MTLAKYKEQLLNEFEARNDDWNFYDFEKRMKELKKGTYYQDAKMIILDAHKKGSWPKTVKRYLTSNAAIMGNWMDIANEIMESLSKEEQEEWHNEVQKMRATLNKG